MCSIQTANTQEFTAQTISRKLDRFGPMKDQLGANRSIGPALLRLICGVIEI